jgi:very-short-patch-repair endonuclease
MYTTESHKKLSEALHRQGEPHRKEVRFCAAGWEYGYRADVYFSRDRVLVEVDGPSHHGYEWRDRIRDAKFRKDLGLRTIRVTNSEIERDADRAARKVVSQPNRWRAA